METALPLLRKHRGDYTADPASAKALLATGFAPLPTELDPAEVAAWTHVARVLFNLHETITRN